MIAHTLKQPTRTRAVESADDSFPSSCGPYLVLLPVGVAVPSMLPPTRCALTAPFHPYPSPEDERRFALCCPGPWGRPRRMLSATVIPWSPDFPRIPCGTRDDPALWLSGYI